MEEKLRKELQKIVESIGEIEPVARFDSDQWKRGQAIIKRIDKSLGSLIVNIKNNEYAVGMSIGTNKGDIFDMLKRDFEPNNKNSQEECFKVPFERIEEVVRYYAGVKKENMEQEFKEWLGQQIPQGHNDRFSEVQINNLCKNLRETIPSWGQVDPDHKNLFAIKDVNIIQGLYKRCLKGGDLYKLNKSVGNMNPSNALGRYKQFLESELSNQGSKNMDELKISKNQILYGPPGTGKTYSTVGKALEILGASNKTDIKSIRKLKEEFSSQVEFVTFHQSFSYEDFVEGLKANSDNGNITYDIENGVFKEICENAKKNLENSQNSIENQIDIKLLLNDFANYVESESIQNEKILLAKKSDGFLGDTYFGEVLRKSNESFRSFKTTGSVASQNLTKNIIIRDYQQFYDGDIKEYKDIKPAQESKTSHHGNALYYYELFTRIKEFQDGKNEKVASYFIDNSNNSKKPYILIIDEINRGNISRIFGELITLIEPSKRAGRDEEISLKLPYSKNNFSVPDNLHIIGTMNTADRSLTMMDTALRRRFDFVEMLPNVDLVKGNFDGINVKEILKAINQHIEVLYDKEHLIGHSFLMHVDNIQELKSAFKNKILPLLEEYFYDDFKKIDLVLGGGNIFYMKEPKTLGKFKKDIYQKQDTEELDSEAFINIYAT